MTEDQLRAFVETLAQAQHIVLTPEQTERVVTTFARTLAIAQPLMAFDLPDEIELAPVFHA